MSAPEVRVEKLVVARLRGFCAGVVRAVETVEKALAACGRPLYVRKEIVHNRRVVEDLKAKGAVFVDELDEVPEGATAVFSAHGVSPEVRERARLRRLRVIDATCPLVTKVHLEALAFAREGRTVFLVGHRGHDEVVGTFGEAPEALRLIETVEDAERVEVPDPGNVAVVTQTTLSLDDARAILDVLRRRFPVMREPGKDDICYATQNRQDAVKALAPKVDLVLVLGAPNSSNSLRMVEVALSAGTPAKLIESASDVTAELLRGVRTLGLTASASAPEVLVQETVAACRERFGVATVEELETVDENVSFSLPSELLRLLGPDGAAVRA